jgi:Zn-dependent peptidase ImmA (M78 family)/transcriptional regulator with XRE-family HTH domain
MGKTLMAEAINGSVLKWAREKQGLALADVAARLKCPADKVLAWEQGESLPTFSQLEKLAYVVYKRPLAVFYFPKPPEEDALSQEFRTLPDAELERLHSDTRYKVRLAHAFKLSLEELNDGRNPADHRIFDSAKLKTSMAVVYAAQKIREQLGVALESQLHWRDTDTAMKAWREAVEACGVYVFKQSFKQKAISGFCLVDKEFPLILINNSTAMPRQIFTLFHELAHLLLGVSTLSRVADWDTSRFDPEAKAVEVFCNAVAGELLVPAADLNAQIGKGAKIDDALIASLAHRYHVSRETILRRFLDRGSVTRLHYEQKAAEWAKQARGAKGKSGGDYYRIQRGGDA